MENREWKMENGEWKMGVTWCQTGLQLRYSELSTCPAQCGILLFDILSVFFKFEFSSPIVEIEFTPQVI
jgi:hypothetical protein